MIKKIVMVRLVLMRMVMIKMVLVRMVKIVSCNVALQYQLRLFSWTAGNIF